MSTNFKMNAAKIQPPNPAGAIENQDASRNSALFSQPFFFLNSAFAPPAHGVRLTAFGSNSPNYDKCASTHAPANPPYMRFLYHSAFRLPHSELDLFRLIPLNSG